MKKTLIIAAVITGYMSHCAEAVVTPQNIATIIETVKHMTNRHDIKVVLNDADDNDSEIFATGNEIHIAPKGLKRLAPMSAEGIFFVVGHEIGHIVLGHTQDQKEGIDQEWSADTFGAKIALRAGANPNVIYGQVYALLYTPKEHKDDPHGTFTQRMSHLNYILQMEVMFR